MEQKVVRILICESEVSVQFEMKPLGDSAVIIQFGSEISLVVHSKVKTLTSILSEHPFTGFIECVPAFTSVTVFYNPFLVQRGYDMQGYKSPYKIVCLRLKELMQKFIKTESDKARIMEIPVCYGGEYGPDLEVVGDYNQLSSEEVIEIHSGGEYLVYMIGFAPGFPYLGGLSEKISTPRRSSPRVSIPVGSVGIAGNQTGIYPISTPGGWQLIGRTPLKLFQPEKNPPTFLTAGDVIKFLPISVEEYRNYEETT